MPILENNTKEEAKSEMAKSLFCPMKPKQKNKQEEKKKEETKTLEESIIEGDLKNDACEQIPQDEAVTHFII